MSACLSPRESLAAAFLHAAERGARLNARAQLQQWLQQEVRHLLRHDVLVVADADPRGRWLQPLLGWSACGAAAAALLHRLMLAWQSAQGACVVDLSLLDAACLRTAAASTAVATPGATPGTTAPLAGCTGEPLQACVHGLAQPGSQRWRLFLAIGEPSVMGSQALLALELLAPCIDAALRRLPPHESPDPRPPAVATPALALSERERQIMTWVAMGKTNPEIGCILRISEFTVKNHLKSIFGKLDVSNRAQAVAKLTGSFSHA